ncbi:condensation domain-containing protein, partial [Streptomyces sp. NPDC001340]
TTPGAGGLTPTDLPLLTTTQADIDTWEHTYPSLADVWPLTPLQSGLLFHAMLADGAYDAYHMQMAFHLTGPVDPHRMHTAGQALLDRHPNLRAAFAPNTTGDLVQLIPASVELPWQSLDLRHLHDEERDQALEQFLTEDRSVHFAPDRPPLLRLALIRLTDERSELVLTAHHVLLDGWSLPLLLNDLLRLYTTNGDTTPLPRPPAYRDHLTYLTHRDHKAATHAWTQELEGLKQPTLLAPYAEPSAAADTGLGQLGIDVPDARAVARCAAELGITLNTLVQGAWAILLSALTGQNDIVFGATASGRPADLPDADHMIGLFINTLPVRVDCTPAQTPADLLTTLQSRQAALLDHHHYPLTAIQQNTGHNTPLFDTLIAFESYPIDRTSLTDTTTAAHLEVTGIRPYAGSHYPLTLTATTSPDLRLTLQYRQDLIDPATAGHIATHCARILKYLTDSPHRALAGIPTPAPGEHQALMDLRAAQRDREPTSKPVKKPYRAPRSAQEKALTELFAEMFGVGRVGIDDDFFAMGGNSLLAIKLVGRIRGLLGVEVPIRTLFECTTVAQLAARTDQSARSRRPSLHEVARERRQRN